MENNKHAKYPNGYYCLMTKRYDIKQIELGTLSRKKDTLKTSDARLSVNQIGAAASLIS